MGVYIKGMDMPKRCAECTFETLFSDDMHYCAVEEILTEDYRDYRECRPPFCPLTEVPETHGRLIDADALADELETDGKEFGDEMKLNCASWLRSNATPTVIERSDYE